MDKPSTETEKRLRSKSTDLFWLPCTQQSKFPRTEQESSGGITVNPSSSASQVKEEYRVMSKALPLNNMQDRTSISKYKSLLDDILEDDETLTGQSSYQLSSKEQTETNDTSKDWLPMDDGITTKLLGSSSTGIASRNEMAAYINEFLCGPRRLNRSILDEIDDWA